MDRRHRHAAASQEPIGPIDENDGSDEIGQNDHIDEYVGHVEHIERIDRIDRRQLLKLAAAFVPAAAAWTTTACAAAGITEITRLQSRPGAATDRLPPGEHRLGLGRDRDGLLYVPRQAATAVGATIPLTLVLHGATQDSSRTRWARDLADEIGFAMLAPDSRGRTWDAITEGFGPDVTFIDTALARAFRHVAVDPKRLAIGGFSDGASYALSLGLMNGDLFSHVIAFSPGFLVPGPNHGRPRLFVSHGTADQILPIERCSRRIVPVLQEAGYDVRYREFDGPHQVPAPIAREAFAWLTGG